MRIMFSSLPWRFVAVLAATFVLTATAPQLALADETIPIPHRAVYRIDLANRENRPGITGAEGRMVIEVAGNACDGYTMSQRLAVRLSADGSDRILDFRISTFETGDGDFFRFISKTMMNDQVVEEVHGSAQRSGRGLDIRLQNPNEKTVKVDGVALFPSQHLHALIAAARADQRFFSTSIYEGAGTGEYVDVVTAVIGSAQRDQANGPLTKNKTRWPVSIAYFRRDSVEGPQQSGEETPVYQMTFMLYENGVTRELVMDYGDYTLSGTMESIIALDRDSCPLK